VCGKRNAYEFRFGGEDKGPRPDEAGLTPSQWCDYVHMNQCASGVQKEWWYHREGCGIWFAVYRDTCTNLQVHASVVEDSKDK
jgi:sarcosine oxidase subunit delta